MTGSSRFRTSTLGIYTLLGAGQNGFLAYGVNVSAKNQSQGVNSILTRA